MGLWIPLSFKITADGDCSHEIKSHLLLERKVMTNLVKSLSRVRLFETPWTVAYQAPPSVGFSRQEYWSGLPQLKQHIKKQRPYFVNKGLSSDEIPVKLFQILKDDAVKVMYSICQQIWKTQQWPQDWKRSVFIPISKKGNAKECSNYCTIARFPGGSVGKASAYNAGDPGSIPGSRRSPEEGNGNPLQYSCLENPMD